MAALEIAVEKCCVSCAEALPKDFFSGSQWRKEVGARCKTCIRAAKNPPTITDLRLSAFVEECQRAKEQYQQSQTEVVSEITSWLHLGGALKHAAAVPGKTTHGICAALERNVTPVLRKAFAESSLLVLNLEDKGSDADMAEALQLAVAFVQEALQKPGSQIYVFCALGCNRSVAVVIALLIAVEGFTLDAALQLVREKRPAIRPKYMRALADFEVRLRSESSRPEFLEAPDSKSLGALY